MMEVLFFIGLLACNLAQLVLIANLCRNLKDSCKNTSANVSKEIKKIRYELENINSKPKETDYDPFKR